MRKNCIIYRLPDIRNLIGNSPVLRKNLPLMVRCRRRIPLSEMVRMRVFRSLCLEALTYTQGEFGSNRSPR